MTTPPCSCSGVRRQERSSHAHRRLPDPVGRPTCRGRGTRRDRRCQCRQDPPRAAAGGELRRGGRGHRYERDDVLRFGRVQAIVAAYRQAAANGTQLRLVATAVLRILTLVGAGQLVPIYPTLEAALAGTPHAHASTPDPGGEHGGTTASGDPQAPTPPAEAQHSGQPRLRRERGGWLAEDLPERSVGGLKFERDQDRPIATDRDLAGVAGGALAAVGSPHILIAPGRDLNQR